MGNTFGHLFRVTTFGESHGPAVGAVIDGCPPLLSLEEQDLQKELNIALIIISHDMGVVARVSDKIAVMYAGQVIETGPVSDVLHAPVHPYTQGLLESIPVPGQIEPGGALGSIPGLVPSLKTRFKGCRFANRC